MSDILKPGKKLEQSQLWKLASELAEFFYSELTQLPEEEKWGMQSKLRQRSFELTSDIAEAVGSIDPRDKAHAYGLSRRSLFGIKNAYILASKAGFLSIDPDVMIKIDKTVALLDAEITGAAANIHAWYEEFQDSKGTQK
jgi:four helix bundle protein